MHNGKGLRFPLKAITYQQGSINQDLIKDTVCEVFIESDDTTVLMGSHVTLPQLYGHRIMREHGNYLAFLLDERQLQQMSRQEEIFSLDGDNQFWFVKHMDLGDVTVLLYVPRNDSDDALYRDMAAGHRELSINGISVNIASPEHVLSEMIRRGSYRIGFEKDPYSQGDAIDASLLMVSPYFNGRSPINGVALSSLLGQYVCDGCNFDREHGIGCLSALAEPQDLRNDEKMVYRREVARLSDRLKKYCLALKADRR
jgi:hypothetical protein